MKRLMLILLLTLTVNPLMASTNYEFFGTVERYELPNGLTVVLKPIEHAESVSTQVWVRAGSLYEDGTNNGLSHLLEHMLFKGTEKFPGSEINRMIESVGGRQNAGTSKDYTNYHVTLPADHWERSLRLLEQMSFHGTLPEDEFKKERKVVLSELARYEDNPKRLLWLRFVPLLYDDHPYHRTTIGQRSVLEEVTHEQLVDYYDRFYTPSRMTLVLSGKFPLDKAKGRIEELFDEEESEPFSRPSFPEIEPPSETSIETQPRDVNRTYGLVGTTGVSMGSGQSIALDVLMELYGGGKDSRLYETVVLQKDLASSISASYWTQEETGPIMIRFQTDRDAEAILEEARSVARSLAEGEIPEDEIQRAKTSIKTDFIYKAQTPGGQARQLGYWETIGTLDYLENYVDRLEAVDADTLSRLAEQLLVEQGWKGYVFVPEN